MAVSRLRKEEGMPAMASESLWTYGAFHVLFTNGKKVTFSKIPSRCCPHWKETPARRYIEKQRALSWSGTQFSGTHAPVPVEVGPDIPTVYFSCGPVLCSATILPPSVAPPLGSAPWGCPLLARGMPSVPACFSCLEY